MSLDGTPECHLVVIFRASYLSRGFGDGGAEMVVVMVMVALVVVMVVTVIVMVGVGCDTVDNELSGDN